nr:transposase, Ptta/En/Spm, transposase, Tnp1/En/Spm-like protein [Tanacetum cinerariifolium]
NLLGSSLRKVFLLLRVIEEKVGDELNEGVRMGFYTHLESWRLRVINAVSCIKALDEGFSSKNYVRKFLRALHPKWREKAKKEPSNEESLTFGGEYEEYAMAVKEFNKFFKIRGRFVSNHVMKESCPKEVETTKIVKAKENALDVEIQIISSESVQSHQEIITKELSLEERGVIATKIKKKRLKTKLVLCLKRLMRYAWE